jgi:hypothetical protein
MKEDEDNLWCNYSGMPSPMSYMRCDKCDEVLCECKCKEKTMNKEQHELLDEAYKNYLNRIDDKFREEDAKMDAFRNAMNNTKIDYTKEEFIDKCKTDSEFSEKWGLKIEERELSLEERMDLSREKRRYSWNWQNWSVEEMEDRMNNDWNIPTRLIIVTYNDKTIKSYE